MNFESIKKAILPIFYKYARVKTYLRYRKTTKIRKLTNEQKREIKKYYQEEFGINVTTRYHELLFSMCGVFKKEFMPFSVYAP